MKPNTPYAHTATSFRAALFLCAALGGAALGGCKDDPPPPLPPGGEQSDLAAGTDSAATAPAKRPQPRRVDPETMKRYRVETCYFGAMGLGVTRDAYMKSSGGKEPGKDNIPSFGEFPENAKKAPNPRTDRVPGRPPLVAAARQLPYIRHLRACNIARSLKQPAFGELDAAIGEFDAYVSPLNKLLLDANRYYARKQYEKDDFKKAKEIHAELIKQLPLLDEKLSALGQALEAWRENNKESALKLVEGEMPKLAAKAVGQARALTMMLLADERDSEAIAATIADLQQARGKLAGSGGKRAHAPYAKVVPPRLQELINVAEKLAKEEGALSAAQTYPLTSAMTLLIEANQRALAQHLRGKGRLGKRAGPSRMIKPRMMKPGGPRPKALTK